jgi:vacuolar-type H+-ATPase subunit H
LNGHAFSGSGNELRLNNDKARESVFTYIDQIEGELQKRIDAAEIESKKTIEQAIEQAHRIIQDAKLEAEALNQELLTQKTETISKKAEAERAAFKDLAETWEQIVFRNLDQIIDYVVWVALGEVEPREPDAN